MLQFYVFIHFDGIIMASFAESSGATLVTQTTLKDENKILVQATVTLTAGNSQTWNLSTILAANATKYDFSSTDIEVYVVDTDSQSPTNGYYVRADAVAGIGFKTTGMVIVSNQYSISLTFLVRIRVTKKVDA